MPDYKYKLVMDTHDWDSIQIETDIMNEVGCQIIPLEYSNDVELVAAIQDADALLPRYVNIQRHHIEAMERCQIISRSGIGVDIVDVEAASEHGIWVTNVPSYCEEEVADHAVALILACARSLLPYRSAVKQGIWRWQSSRQIKRLSSSVFGLIGFGKIGKLIWQRMKGFDCEGLVFDPYIPSDSIEAAGAVQVELDELLSRADIIHIQAPLNQHTHHLIGEEQLGLLKPGAILTNASRGPIIDENALFQGLQSGKLAAAGLDDLEEEPAKIRGWEPDNPLIHLPNVIVTPHSAWYSEQSAQDVKRISAEEIARVLSGQRPLYPVNQPVFGRK